MCSAERLQNAVLKIAGYAETMLLRQHKGLLDTQGTFNQYHKLWQSMWSTTITHHHCLNSKWLIVTYGHTCCSCLVCYCIPQMNTTKISLKGDTITYKVWKCQITQTLSGFYCSCFAVKKSHNDIYACLLSLCILCLDVYIYLCLHKCIDFSAYMPFVYVDTHTAA